jgi:hypothetical protein
MDPLMLHFRILEAVGMRNCNAAGRAADLFGGLMGKENGGGVARH